VWHIVECLHNDARTLDRAVMVAVAVGAPLKHKGGGTHGGVVVFVATMDAVFKDFKGTPKVWSRYWPSPAFRCRSSDTRTLKNVRGSKSPRSSWLPTPLYPKLRPLCQTLHILTKERRYL